MAASEFMEIYIQGNQQQENIHLQAAPPRADLEQDTLKI